MIRMKAAAVFQTIFLLWHSEKKVPRAGAEGPFSVQQMFMGAVIDLLLLQEADQALIVPSRRSQNISFDAVVACHLGGMIFKGDLAYSGRNRMLRNIAERRGNRRDKLVEEILRVLSPQVPGRFDVMILPVKLGFAVGFGKHLEEFAEHEVSAYRDEEQKDAYPEDDEPHESCIIHLYFTSLQMLYSNELYLISRFLATILVK